MVRKQTATILRESTAKIVHQGDAQSEYASERIAELPFLCLASNECTTFANSGCGSVLCESKRNRLLAHVLLRNCANLVVHPEMVRRVGMHSQMKSQRMDAITAVTHLM